MRRTLLPLLLSAAALLLPACGGSGVAAVRIDLKKDLSGTLTTSSLVVSAQGGPIEKNAAGISWTDRANLYCASGNFKSVSDVRIEDITLRAGKNDDFHYLRITLPTGEKARWPTALTPTPKDRQRAARTFDPRRSFSDVATHVTFEVDLPGRVMGHSVSPPSRGVKSERTRKRVTLIVPVDRVRAADESWVWLLTWQP